MPGSLSIANATSKTPNAAALRAYAILGVIGVFAGLAVVHGRLGLGLPGHKALFWMPAILIARMVCPAAAGATVGATATVGTTMLLGGHLAGGVLLMPLIILAGGLFDLAVAALRRVKASPWLAIVVLTGTGGLANLVCYLKKAFVGVHLGRSLLGLTGAPAVAASYLLFGLLAGLAGAIGAQTALAASRKRRKRIGNGTDD